MSRKSFATPRPICDFLKTRLARLLIISTLGVSTVIGCGWSYLTEHSVRFNSERTGRGFYRLPPLPIAVNPVTGKEQSVNETDNYDDYDGSSYEAEQAALEGPNKVWDRAIAANDGNDHSGLGKQLNEYLEITKYLYTDESNTQQ
ncbi:MAG TPA: hypothetical protein VJL58_08085, partial [Pyrinomonadaceae bacterium]|nr:hypothetical protein [Pyrinomonadaceae bacterium]